MVTRPRFGLQSAELKWSGMVMEPFDYLAFSGRDPAGRENVYVHTGDSGHGMTHGVLGAILGLRDADSQPEFGAVYRIPMLAEGYKGRAK